MVNFSEIYFSLHSSVCGGDSRRVQQPQQSGRLRRGQQLNVQRSIKKIPLFDCQIFTLSFSDEVRRYSFVLLLSPLLPIYALPKVAGSVINKKTTSILFLINLSMYISTVYLIISNRARAQIQGKKIINPSGGYPPHPQICQ